MRHQIIVNCRPNAKPKPILVIQSPVCPLLCIAERLCLCLCLCVCLTLSPTQCLRQYWSPSVLSCKSVLKSQQKEIISYKKYLSIGFGISWLLFRPELNNCLKRRNTCVKLGAIKLITTSLDITPRLCFKCRLFYIENYWIKSEERLKSGKIIHLKHYSNKTLSCVKTFGLRSDG